MVKCNHIFYDITEWFVQHTLVQPGLNTLVQHMAMNMIMDIHMQNLRLFQKSGMYNGCHFRKKNLRKQT